jgi:hypothetical protein
MRDENVRFIRRNGRVIPIRVKGSFKPKKQSKPKKVEKIYDKPSVQFGVFSTAGLGISALGGRFAGRQFKKADKMHQQSFDFGMDKPFSKLPKGAKTVSEGFEKSRRRAKFGVKSKLAFKIAGASALSLGFTKGLEAIGYDKPTMAQEASRETGALLASHLVMEGFAKGFNGKGLTKKKFSMKAPDSLKRLAKDIGTRFIKKQLKFKI